MTNGGPAPLWRSYHDLLYANARKAAPEHLKAFAQDVGLNLPAFEQCLGSPSDVMVDLPAIREGEGVPHMKDHSPGARLRHASSYPYVIFPDTLEHE